MNRISVYPILEKQKPKAANVDVVIKRLKKLPFWCYDDKLHENNAQYQRKGCCFTHVVGLPTHPATKQPMALTPYQIEFAEIILNARKGDTFPKPHKYHVNKGRQMGFTEIVLRVIQFNSMHEYANSNVGIMAATNGSLAKKDLRRFQRLFKHVKLLVTEWLKNNKMELATGTVVEAFPASEEAMTGDTDYRGIFLDEAAKWRGQDDKPIFNSIMPIVNTNAADLFLVSTPKGPVKTFYELHKDPKDFIKMKFDLWRAEGNLYSREQIQFMLDNATEDPNQEYLCYDDMTEVLTDGGFVKFEDLTGNEHFASLNIDSLDIEYVQAIVMLKKQLKGGILNLKNRWFNLKVTPEHQMLVYKPKTFDKRSGKAYPERFSFKRADELNKFDKIYRSSKWVGESPATINVNGYNMDTDTYCKLMGYYLSEGSTILEYAKTDRMRSNIAQYHGANYERIWDDLKSISSARRGTTSIIIRDQRLTHYLRQFGHSNEKYIPAAIKMLSKRHIRLFLDAFNLGDGTTHRQIPRGEFKGKKFKPQKFYVTASERIRDGLMELILKAGKTPSCYEGSKKGTPMTVRGKTYKTNHDTYTIHEGSRQFSKIITMSISEEPYDGFVYCVSLPRNHTLYVRRNGQCAWSGNCKFTFGKDAVLGEITDADRDPFAYEWNLDESEDDGYVEEEEEEWLIA